MTPPHPAPSRPGTLAVWWAAIRPRTLGMALAPVMLGTALAVADGAELAWEVLFATVSCALLIQIGTNLYNDAIDFERGTDRPERLGPLRVTLAGWASAAEVKRG
ncbi:MAG: prenyltransferase, partial [Thauera sp.]|nr:prenyltransferase [Thauera sp.]